MTSPIWLAGRIRSNQKTTADNSIQLLRKTFVESGYPHGFLYMAMIQIAGDAYMENRDGVTPQSLKQAWIKIGDLLCQESHDI